MITEYKVMRQKISALLFTFTIMSTFAAYSQTEIDNIMSQIVEHSTILKASYVRAEAAKAENKTVNSLDAPEIGVNYLWGSPSEIGNRVDVSVTQSFDFPTAYIHRGRLNRRRNATADLEYQKVYFDLQQEVIGYCVTLAYTNTMIDLYDKYKSAVETICSMTDKAMEAGESTVIEQRKARIILAEIMNRKAVLHTKKDEALSGLVRLNSGDFPAGTEALDLENIVETFFIRDGKIVDDDSTIVKSNPYMAYADSKVSESEGEIKLARAMNLPKFSLGYMSEKTPDEHFQGLTFSVSLPIWGAANRVRLAKAEYALACAEATDTELALRSKINSLNSQVSTYRKQLLAIKSLLVDNDYLPMLRKSMDSGEITIFDFLTEVRSALETRASYLETMYEYCLLSAELASYKR